MGSASFPQLLLTTSRNLGSLNNRVSSFSLGNSGFSSDGSVYSSGGNSGFSRFGGNSGFSSGGNVGHRVSSIRFGNTGGDSGYSSGISRSSGGSSGYSSGFSSPRSNFIFASNNQNSGFSSGSSGHGRIINLGGGSGRSRSYY